MTRKERLQKRRADPAYRAKAQARRASPEFRAKEKARRTARRVCCIAQELKGFSEIFNSWAVPGRDVSHSVLTAAAILSLVVIRQILKDGCLDCRTIASRTAFERIPNFPSSRPDQIRVLDAVLEGRA